MFLHIHSVLHADITDVPGLGNKARDFFLFLLVADDKPILPAVFVQPIAVLGSREGGRSFFVHIEGQAQVVLAGARLRDGAQRRAARLGTAPAFVLRFVVAHLLVQHAFLLIPGAVARGNLPLLADPVCLRRLQHRLQRFHRFPDALGFLVLDRRQVLFDDIGNRYQVCRGKELIHRMFFVDQHRDRAGQHVYLFLFRRGFRVLGVQLRQRFLSGSAVGGESVHALERNYGVLGVSAVGAVRLAAQIAQILQPLLKSLDFFALRTYCQDAFSLAFRR